MVVSQKIVLGTIAVLVLLAWCSDFVEVKVVKSADFAGLQERNITIHATYTNGQNSTSSSTLEGAQLTPQDKDFLGLINSTKTEENVGSENGEPMVEPTQTVSDTGTTSNTQAQSPQPAASQYTDDDIFDPNLTDEDYLALNPSTPSVEWLQNCAETLANDTTIVKPFPTLRTEYALGDCLKLCNKCERGLPGRGQKKWRNYKDTMAGYYGQLACRGETRDPMNYTIMDQVMEIFGEKDGFEKPAPADVVIHLRLGDVVEHTGKEAKELLTRGGIPRHPSFKRAKAKAILSVFDYLNILKNHTSTGSIGKVIIVGGSHKPELYRTSRLYANCLQRGLLKAGINTELQLDNRDADKDFYFMTYAKRVMISGGGFSRFVGQFAVSHGGEILNPTFDTFKR